VPLESGLRERHIPFGVIYNADAETRSDAMFLDSARRHISEVEVALGIHPDTAIFRIHPDTAIFQSWVRWPTRMLPETERGTYTNLVFQYLQPNPNMNLNRRDNALGGMVAGDDVPHAHRPFESDIIYDKSLNYHDIFGIRMCMCNKLCRFPAFSHGFQSPQGAMHLAARA
jgi:hypothetical protein